MPNSIFNSKSNSKSDSISNRQTDSMIRYSHCREKSSRLESMLLQITSLNKISQFTPTAIAEMFLCFKMSLNSGCEKISLCTVISLLF